MKKYSRHIAFLLLIFIAYPFIFQVLHILYHDHKHTAVCRTDYSGHYHVCSSHHCDESDDNSDKPDNPFFSARHVAGISEQPDHEDAHCHLCEHEFAKFSVKSSFQISFNDERFSLVNNYLYQSPSVLYTGNHRSLRAPPGVITS